METSDVVPLNRRPTGRTGPLLSDYVALDRLRTVRRLLLVRCGALALITAVAGPLVGWLSAVGRSLVVAVFLLPPAWTWILERRADLRLSARLRSIKTMRPRAVRRRRRADAWRRNPFSDRSSA